MYFTCSGKTKIWQEMNKDKKGAYFYISDLDAIITNELD